MANEGIESMTKTINFKRSTEKREKKTQVEIE